MISARPGFSCLIETIRLADIKRFGKETVITAMLSGGAFVANIPEGVTDILPEEIKRVTRQYELDSLKAVEGTSIVQVISDIWGNLNEVDQEALLYHEEGHVIAGHVGGEYQKGKETQNGILIDVNAEIEADAYAVSKVGKRRVAIALTHVVENLCKVAGTKFGTVPLNENLYREHVTELLMRHDFRARFAALQ